jgi:hypothetical protein
LQIASVKSLIEPEKENKRKIREVDSRKIEGL